MYAATSCEFSADSLRSLEPLKSPQLGSRLQTTRAMVHFREEIEFLGIAFQVEWRSWAVPPEKLSLSCTMDSPSRWDRWTQWTPHRVRSVPCGRRGGPVQEDLVGAAPPGRTVACGADVDLEVIGRIPIDDHVHVEYGRLISGREAIRPQRSEKDLDGIPSIRRTWTQIMGLRQSLMLFGFFALSSGCGMAENFVHDTAFEVKRVSDETCEKIHNRRLANAAWREVENSTERGSYSADYASGFKDGYASYLFAGGNGEPPSSLPGCYWGARYETPQGYQAIQDWFSGYRHGVVAAQQSGLRDLVVFPVGFSDPDLASYHPYPVLPGSPARIQFAPTTPDQLEKPLPAPTPLPGQASELHPPRQGSPNSAEQRAPRLQPAGPGKPRGIESADKPKPD